jgi:hypothetical protein
MSFYDLSALLDANTFLPSPLPDDLLACHVPFDELLPGSAVESALEDRAIRGVATALIGCSGSGKSAVMAWVLDRVTTDFATIRAPVFYETDETVQEAGPFSRYLLQRLLEEARSVAALGPEERDRLLRQASERLTVPSQTIGHRFRAGMEVPWLLKGDVARDVSTTLEGAELQGSTDATLQAVDEVILAIGGQGLTPMIVLDDTDRWLRVGEVDRRELVGRFFGSIVRMLAERGCGLVVAVHESYLELPEYQNGTRGFLTDSVRVPELREVAALNAILEHRIAIQMDGTALHEVIDSDASERLFSYYQTAGSRSLRWTLQIAHSALTASVGAGTETITAAAIDDAAAG